MDWSILIPSLKSLFFNPPPLRVWLNILKYKIFLISKKSNVKHSPLSIVAYVTKRCNFKCEFCFTYSDLNKPNWQDGELNLLQLEKILKTKMGKDALRVGFLGGEPFLNSELFEMLSMAHRYGKITTIVTNASLVTDDFKKKLLINYPTMLGISLYDNNINEVAELSLFLSKYHKDFWVQSVIAADELNQIENKILFAHQNKIKNLILSNYHPSYSKEYSKVIYDDNEQFKALAKRAKELSTKFNINLTLPAPIEKNKTKRSCNMAFSYVHVDSKGTLGPCCFRAPNEKYGSIFNSNDWNGNEIVKLRDSFINHNILPLSECEHCENFSRDLYGV